MEGYNSQAFVPEEVEKGLHLELVKDLLELEKKMSDMYYDIHITSDGYCTIVEWKEVGTGEMAYDSGKFEYVGPGQVVMEETQFPDEHYEYLFPNEIDERMSDWHKENPGWIKSGLMNTWSYDKDLAKKEKLTFTTHWDNGKWLLDDGSLLSEHAPKEKK